jgi:hypothetical protein
VIENDVVAEGFGDVAEFDVRGGFGVVGHEAASSY